MPRTAQVTSSAQHLMSLPACEALQRPLLRPRHRLLAGGETGRRNELDCRALRQHQEAGGANLMRPSTSLWSTLSRKQGNVKLTADCERLGWNSVETIGKVLLRFTV